MAERLHGHAIAEAHLWSGNSKGCRCSRGGRSGRDAVLGLSLSLSLSQSLLGNHHQLSQLCTDQHHPWGARRTKLFRVIQSSGTLVQRRGICLKSTSDGRVMLPQVELVRAPMSASHLFSKQFLRNVFAFHSALLCRYIRLWGNVTLICSYHPDRSTQSLFFRSFSFFSSSSLSCCSFTSADEGRRFRVYPLQSFRYDKA